VFDLTRSAKTRTVLVTDDVASAPIDLQAKRRGVVGDFVVFKIAGAAADRGDSLNRVEQLARKANAATVSFGVAFDGCTFPGKTEPLFSVQPGHMDLGLGIHGEPGIKTVEWIPARELAGVLLEPLLAERPAGDRPTRAAVILNGLGATKYEELFVLWQTLGPLFDEHGIVPVLPEVGEIVTSLDMAGCSLTLTWLGHRGTGTLRLFPGCAGRILEAPNAQDVSAFGFRQAAPHPMRFAGSQGPGRASADDGAAMADMLGLGDAGDLLVPAFAGWVVEGFDVHAAAGGGQLPVPVLGDRPCGLMVDGALIGSLSGSRGGAGQGRESARGTGKCDAERNG